MENQYGEKIIKKIIFEELRGIISVSKIPENFKTYKWKDYCANKIDGKKIKSNEVIESRLNAKKICKNYCLDYISYFDKVKKDPTFFQKKLSLIIYGAETSGKTVLATLIARALAEKSQRNILFVDFMDLNAEACVVQDFRGENFTALVEKYLDPDILIIDEICKNKTASMLESLLSAILRQRQNNGNKITIITSKIEKNSIGNYIGTDSQRIINKELDFISVHIMTESPYFLESNGENIYNLEKLKKIINSKKSYTIKNSEINLILKECVETK